MAILKFREQNRDIFEAIRTGKKKIETRAATPKYRAIRVGDTVELVCGDERFTKTIGSVELFKTVDALTKTYAPRDINSSVRTNEELAAMYLSFPGYKEKLQQYGIVAWKLE